MHAQRRERGGEELRPKNFNASKVYMLGLRAVVEKVLVTIFSPLREKILMRRRRAETWRSAA
jgi:hypothetical protein